MPFTSYATQQDMIDNFTEQEIVELTNLADPDATAINTDVLDQALEEAAAEIDAYLGARYDVEAIHDLDPFPKNLIRVNADIARYRLDNDCTREPVIQRFRDALKFLEGLTKGTITLGLPTSEPAAATGGPSYTAPTPVFSRDTLSDY